MEHRAFWFSPLLFALPTLLTLLTLLTTACKPNLDTSQRRSQEQPPATSENADLAGPTQGSAPEVLLVSGKVSGKVIGTVRAFLGIPFASPPVGAKRWQPPQAVTPWRGVRPATSMPPPCLQPNGLSATPLAGSSEDCLYLNVWTAGGGGANPPPRHGLRAWGRLPFRIGFRACLRGQQSRQQK